MACVRFAQRLGKRLATIKLPSVALPHYQVNCCRLIFTRSGGKVGEKLNFNLAGKICCVTSLTFVGGLGAYFAYAGYGQQNRTGTILTQPSLAPTVYADVGVRPIPVPTRTVLRPMRKRGLKLTLYQYESCPFCCKVRAFLDYYGFSYDVVEVDAVRRTQIKWSKRHRLPLLVIENVGEEGYLEVDDSSLIISVLRTYVLDSGIEMPQVVSYYPAIESENKKGKKIVEYPNRYFVMRNNNDVKVNEDVCTEERKWRRWTDDVLMHVISPNIYRSVGEARQAVACFAKTGEWKKHFSGSEYWLVVLVGPYAMYILGRSLKKRYNLNDDVRQSLYDACTEWGNALGNRRFLGGEKPNLADLSVYGVLSCMEGCDSFDDVMTNTSLKRWYDCTKGEIRRNNGAREIAN